VVTLVPAGSIQKIMHLKEKISCTYEESVHLLRKSSDDDNQHIEMGLLFELEVLEQSVNAFETLRTWFCLWENTHFATRKWSPKRIDFCVSFLRKVLRTMFETCPRPISTLWIDWKGFCSLKMPMRM